VWEATFSDSIRHPRQYLYLDLIEGLAACPRMILQEDWYNIPGENLFCSA
jgi:hypothetical protein